MLKHEYRVLSCVLYVRAQGADFDGVKYHIAMCTQNTAHTFHPNSNPLCVFYNAVFIFISR